MNNKNPFKEIETDKDAPSDLKKEIFENVNFIKFLTQAGELFLVNAPTVIGEVFKTNKVNKK